MFIDTLSDGPPQSQDVNMYFTLFYVETRTRFITVWPSLDSFTAYRGLHYYQCGLLQSSIYRCLAHWLQPHITRTCSWHRVTTNYFLWPVDPWILDFLTRSNTHVTNRVPWILRSLRHVMRIMITRLGGGGGGGYLWRNPQLKAEAWNA